MEKLLNFVLADLERFTQIRNELHAFYPFSINTIQRFKDKHSELPIQDLINQMTLQKRALQKLPYAEKWFFTDKGLQQASDYLLANYHGMLFKDYTTVADICCGIGSDLLYLSNGKEKCFAIDKDHKVLSITQHNMRVFDRKNILYQNIMAEEFSSECQAVFIDPDRRTVSKKRTAKIEEISPNISTIIKLINNYHNVAVKLSPIINYDDIKLSDYSFDFVSVNGDLKECLLKTGDLKAKKQAVIINKFETKIFSECHHPQTHISPIGNWLFEPDPAIIRSHLVNDLAFELKMNRIDPNIALLTQDDAIEPTVFGNAYQVSGIFDYNLKSLNSYLKSHQIGVVDIKTKGFSESVEHFRKKLILKGNNKVILFIIRIGEKHICVIS